MIRPFLFALCAAVAFADPAAVKPAGKLPVRAPSGGGGRARQGQISAKTLFGLVARAGCDSTSLTGPLCPQGSGCCYYEDTCCGEKMCLLAGEACCDGKFSCVTDESCCGSGCMPSDAVCCGDGTYSHDGQSGCSADNPFSIFSPGPTFTDRHGLSGATGSPTSANSYSALSYGVSTPTYTSTYGATAGNSFSGDCGGAQKVLNGGAANKGGGGHGGGSSGGHSSSGDSGSSSGDSSSGSSGSGYSSGSGTAGCASSASMIVLSMSTLMGAFLGTVLLL